MTHNKSQKKDNMVKKIIQITIKIVTGITVGISKSLKDVQKII